MAEDNLWRNVNVVECHRTWDEFLAAWPVEKVRSMTLEEYTNLNRVDAFVYWLEFRLMNLGSIRGGFAFKFGIFARGKSDEMESKRGRSYTDDYAWNSSLGATPEEAFEEVRGRVLKVIDAAQRGALAEIEEVGLADMFKWKLAFHYQDRSAPSIIPVFFADALRAIDQAPSKTPLYQIYKKLGAERPIDSDILEYGAEIWNQFVGMLRMWKVSHGKADFGPQERERYLQERQLVVHGSTKKSQGNAFAKKMQVGDYVCLCHGNDVGILLIGRVTSEAEPCDKGEGWLRRSYEPLHELDPPQKYSGKKKGWAPNYNSTCKFVPQNELDLFEEEILLKHFGIGLGELSSAPGGEKPGFPAGTDLPLNLILYGPPGTGKTYRLLTEIAREQFTDIVESQTQEEFAETLMENSSWWQAVTFAMLDLKECKVADILAHPLMKIKIAQSANQHPRAAIWAHLQIHTKTDCEQVGYKRRAEPLLFSKDSASRWSIDLNVATELVPDLVEKLNQYHNYRPKRTELKRFEFVSFHQSYSYEDFIEGIKPVMEEDAGPGELQYEIKPGVFKEICAKARRNPDKRYALLIDEINRGNVASTFGELISLIEDDKRSAAENEMAVRLPYSRETFNVPGNLHIVGTMNTADRSVEALDTALRRRFEFEGMNPEIGLLPEGLIEGVDVRLMLGTINARIERLLDKDHCIGHSYLMKARDLQGIRAAFARKILPLLEEYFYGNLGKIGMVLGSAFVTREPHLEKSMFPKGWQPEDIDEREVHNLADPMKLNAEAFTSIYLDV